MKNRRKVFNTFNVAGLTKERVVACASHLATVLEDNKRPHVVFYTNIPTARVAAEMLAEKCNVRPMAFDPKLGFRLEEFDKVVLLADGDQIMSFLAPHALSSKGRASGKFQAMTSLNPGDMVTLVCHPKTSRAANTLDVVPLGGDVDLGALHEKDTQILHGTGASATATQSAG